MFRDPTLHQEDMCESHRVCRNAGGVVGRIGAIQLGFVCHAPLRHVERYTGKTQVNSGYKAAAHPRLGPDVLSALLLCVPTQRREADSLVWTDGVHTLSTVVPYIKFHVRQLKPPKVDKSNLNVFY